MANQNLNAKPAEKIRGLAKSREQTAVSSLSQRVIKEELCDIFREAISQDDELNTQLQKQLTEGAGFFEKWNESRIGLAFESFDVSMKYALFEIIYLLHVNDAKYQTWKYQVFQPSSRKQGEDVAKEADIFVEGAPCGVKGFSELSPIFRADFESYIQKTFAVSGPMPDSQSEPPIEGIYSIGSVGTVGHKNIDSDLDLQVQFNLQPFFFDTSGWRDELLLEKLCQEQNQLVQNYYLKKGLNMRSQPEVRQKKVISFFKQQLRDKYPVLFQHFYSKGKDIIGDLKRDSRQQLRMRLVHEIINLMKQSVTTSTNSEIQKKERLLKTRIEKIQTYVNDKFPEAEIYLFSFSRQQLQKGYFGTTVESKESSGGAYELILNYETLFPGIYFTPVIPSHFLFTQKINNDSGWFYQICDFIGFGLLEGFAEVSGNVNFQGPTPDLDPLYVAQHSAAAYWEAFKGTSGNLPKATLNLLRFEMLLQKHLNKTNIQMVKDPAALDRYIFPPEPDNRKLGVIYSVSKFIFPAELESEGDESESASESDKSDTDKGFSADRLKKFESRHPGLEYDPWWLRYKSLKIGYGEPGLIPLVPEDQLRGISDIIDLAFAFHVRVSDVFTKPGARKDFSRHRERVLQDYLSTVFPEGSKQRHRLNATFIGDVQTVNEFEKELRQIFQNSVERIHEKVSTLKTDVDKQASEEERIWYHYYKQSFKSPPNVIQKSILNHLQVPRGRLQIGLKKKSGWFFRSLQKGSSMGKRFESSILNLLPEEITLVENLSFLNGLVHCVINGYYGVFNRGQLSETKTMIEYDRQNMNLGSKLDNSLAFLRPDQIQRVMEQILDLFPARKVSYLDCISKERVINEMMVFLNLMKYGQLSVLYRDSLNTYYVDEFVLPDFQKNVGIYTASYKKMLMTGSLHKGLRKFLVQKKINIFKVKLAAWVNTNSAETTHAVTQYKTKEKNFAEEFKEIIQQESRKQD